MLSRGQEALLKILLEWVFECFNACECGANKMSLTGEQLTENYQLLEPVGLREGKNLCLWRQLNQDIRFPVHLVVDEGMNACFASSGKIVGWFSSGEYYLDELVGMETAVSETSDGWKKLRLFYIKSFSEIKVSLRSDHATANIGINCKVIDDPNFWSYYLKPSYT